MDTAVGPVYLQSMDLQPIVQFFGWFAGGVACASLFLIHPLGWIVGTIGLVCGGLSLRQMPRPQLRMLVLLWPLITAAAAIILGMVFRYDDYGVTNPAPKGPEYLLDGLGVAHLVGCLFVVACARGFRLVAGSSLCVGSFVFGGCSVIAGMSITGIWL